MQNSEESQKAANMDEARKAILRAIFQTGPGIHNRILQAGRILAIVYTFVLACADERYWSGWIAVSQPVTNFVSRAIPAVHNLILSLSIRGFPARGAYAGNVVAFQWLFLGISTIVAFILSLWLQPPSDHQSKLPKDMQVNDDNIKNKKGIWSTENLIVAVIIVFFVKYTVSFLLGEPFSGTSINHSWRTRYNFDIATGWNGLFFYLEANLIWFWLVYYLCRWPFSLAGRRKEIRGSRHPGFLLAVVGLGVFFGYRDFQDNRSTLETPNQLGGTDSTAKLTAQEPTIPTESLETFGASVSGQVIGVENIRILLPDLLPIYAMGVGHRDWLVEHCGISGFSIIGQDRTVHEFATRWLSWKTWNHPSDNESTARQRLATSYQRGYGFDQHCDWFGSQNDVEKQDAAFVAILRLNPDGPDAQPGR